MKRIMFVFSSVLLLSMFPFSSAYAIKKCQDAQGKWHYGDIAVAECQRSKVTTLNSRGFIAKEKEAPKTPEQLQKEAEQLQKEKEAQELRDAEIAIKQAEEDERNRILSIYETEADIDRQRDNQINSVDSNIAVHKAYVKAVNAKVERLKLKGANFKGVGKERNLAEIAEADARVKESADELEKLENQKKSIMQRFAREKKIYRELKNPA